MFKKPPADLKTSAPLRSSDRRKLKQRVLQTFAVLQPEEGDALVPEGLLVQKFSTHLDEPGVAYISPEGDPLWITLGKGSDDLIPTVYTLWKRPDLLPFLSTPAPVVPKLIGGADLMIPGVVQHSPALQQGQLVSITQYQAGALGVPLAVGRMAVSGGTLAEAEDKDIKGKAVYIVHTWRDALWEMGVSKKADVPEPRAAGASAQQDENADLREENDSKEVPGSSVEDAGAVDGPSSSDGAPMSPESAPHVATNEPPSGVSPLTAEDVSSCLRTALLQALSTTLASLPPSAFPIPASTFWSSYILPARPAQVPGTHGVADASGIDIKQSTYKSVKTFLKACAKEGLLKLKDAKGGDVIVAAVFTAHPAVSAHRPYKSVRDIETRQQKAEDRERREQEQEQRRRGEIQATELWKSHGATVPWFSAAAPDKDTTALWTPAELKALLHAYVAAKGLVNAREQQYVNVGEDALLLRAVERKNELGLEFLRREDVLARLREHMQAWHELRVEGRDVVRKKGELKPIAVAVKLRQGRKACTLVTGFEPFFLDADELADELRRMCASSTSVSPVAGRPSQMEVMVQGKQVEAVIDMLVGKGVPKRWIESVDHTTKKK
ncbi:eukaryotic translation initiation factor SUI1 family protein [Amylocystis lapponica]|nr:eukaryotic translation initiation factor SUI1 family protein [Amylocystis lapponica]